MTSRGKSGGRLAAAIAALAVSLALPAGATGAVTIGAKLETLTPLVGAYNCDTPHCTLINSALGSANTEPGGLTSPVTGTIVGFRLRTGGDPASDVSLRVLRGSGTTFTGAGTGPPVNQAANQTVLHPVSLPIRAGDHLGVNCCSGDDGITTSDVPGSGTFLVWGTAAALLLADGETRAFDSDHQDNVVMMNADVEPSNALTIDGAKVKKGKVIATVTAPNDGTVTMEPATAFKKCKAPRCGPRTRRVSIQVKAGVATEITARIVKAIRRAALERGRFKFKATLGYQPTLGDPALFTNSFVTTKKLKLKARRKG
jgi:hypothetical protein